VLGFLSLVRRRWQVLASSNNAQEQLDEAEALVLQSRTKVHPLSHQDGGAGLITD
jgi:hypothetical protein